MRRRSRTRTRTNYDRGDYSQNVGYQLKPLRPRRIETVQVIRPDYHYPSRLRRLNVNWTHKTDPRNYDESILRQYSSPLPKYYDYPSRRPKRLRPGDREKICRQRRTRKAVLFAAGLAGMRGPLSPPIRRRRNRKHRNAPRIKC